MSEDAELLRRYVSEKSEAAFAELVQQHLGFVYQTAIRQLDGDSHGAEDVAQAVFTDLARKAPSLMKRPLLAGWLHTSTRYAASRFRRTERRRQVREQEAHLMQELTRESGPAQDWESLRPIIDDALHALSPDDREAVILRFFEGRAFADVGARLNLSEDTARFRVDRALDKLQPLLARRGINSTTGALALALGSQAAFGAPAGLAPVVATTALSASAAGGGITFTLGTLGLMKASTLILAGSLAANAILGSIYVSGMPETDPGMPRPPIGSLSMPPEKSAPPPSPAVAAKLRGAVDIGRRLRADGFSDRVVYHGVVNALMDVFPNDEARKLGDSLRARMRRWNPNPQRSVAVVPGLVPPTGEPSEEQRIQWAATRAVFAELGYDPSGAPLRSLYRNIPADKAAVISQIEDDYRKVRESSMSQRGNSAALSAAIGSKIADEFEADIRAALTPEEAAAYFRYNSDTGKRVQASLEELNVSDETFAVLADATLDVERRRRALAGDRSAAARLETNLLKTYRQELGDERFLQVVPQLSSASTFASIDVVYRQAQVSPARRADLLFTMVDSLAAIEAAGPPFDLERVAQLHAALTSGAGLDPGQTDAFNRTSFGRKLLNPPVAPSPGPAAP